MSNESTRLNDSIDVLHSLLDVTPSPQEDTIIFKNIPHEELCKALKFWFDQTRLCFGEATQTEIIHGTNEAGVDVFIDLLKEPSIRFAIQVKSYKDIQDDEQSFSEKVHSQINRSHKHNLTKIVVGFAADMTDNKQSGKVSYVTSDIHQIKGDNEYVSIVSSSQLLTIYKTYESKLNPLDFINFNLGNSARLAAGLTRSMSNNRRKAKIKIELEYPKDNNDQNNLKIKFTTKQKDEELNLLARLENLSEDDKLVISKEQLQVFEVYEGDKKIYSGNEGDLIFTNTPAPYSIKFQTLNDGNILYSLSDIPFLKKDENEVSFFNIMDEDQPLRIKLEFRKNGEMRYSFKVEEYRCDVARLLPVLKFLKTFTNAKELKITISNQGEKELQGDIPENMQKSLVDDNYYRLVESLAFIQEKSGYILRISKDSIIKADEIRTIFVVENAIKHGMINDFEFDIDAKLNRIQALHIIQKIKKGKNDFSYEYELPPFKILGREVSLGPGRIISDNFECKEDVEKLYEKLIGSKEDTAVLKLRGKGECILHWFS